MRDTCRWFLWRAMCPYACCNRAPMVAASSRSSYHVNMCVREAEGIVRHPLLGDVPTCRRCAERFGLDLIPQGAEHVQ